MGITEKDIPNWIELNGDRSSDHNIVVELIPKDTIPERDVVFYHVTGSNGDLIRDNKTFKNVERTYNIAILNESGDRIEYQKRLIEATNWLYQLNNIDSYSIIRDSYSEKFYRKGIFVGPAEITNMFYRAGRGEVIFKLRPEKYLNLDRTHQIDVNRAPVISEYKAPFTFIDNMGIDEPYFTFGSVPVIEFRFRDDFQNTPMMPGEDSTMSIIVDGWAGENGQGIVFKMPPKTYTFLIDYANPGDTITIDCETTQMNQSSKRPVDPSLISKIFVDNYPKVEGPSFKVKIPEKSVVRKYIKEIIIKPRWYVL